MAAASASPVSGASAASSAAGSPPGRLFSHRLDVSQLWREYPPVGEFRTERNKRRVYAKILQARQTPQIQPQAASATVAAGPPLLRFARYDTRSMPIDDSRLLTATTEFVLAPHVYAYNEAAATATAGASSTTSASEIHWYVNFADASLFGFYASSLFAQDEWQCLEHPTLCSLREYLAAARSQHPHAQPLTVERGRGPTPCLVMNAPREAAINAVTHNIYGNNFCLASPAVIDRATRILSPPTLSHIIAMEALKHGRGVYTEEQIRVTLQTAVSAFEAARFETFEECAASESAATQPKIVVHTGNWVGRARDSYRRRCGVSYCSHVLILMRSSVRVRVQGCGAFGGNVSLMCMVQLLAARLAGVDRVVYHVLGAGNEAECERAAREVGVLLREVAATKHKTNNAADQPRFEQVVALIAKRGFKWGLSNGT